MNDASARPLTCDDLPHAADRFLASCVAAIAAGSALPAWPKAGAADAFGGSVVSRAEFHGIALLLARAGLPACGWPAVISDALAEHARLAGLWEELHKPRIAALIETLADSGIPSLVLKGTALAYLFHDDPAIRRRGDTDLLVKPADLARVREALRTTGWISPADNHGLYFQES